MSATIVLIDTSIFDEILGVPGKSQNREQVLDALDGWIQQGASLLLPMATVIEAGNHIAQAKGDKQGRIIAEQYVKQVRMAMTDQSPFTATPGFNPDRVLEWIDAYPDYAVRGIGTADLSIIKEWERQRELNPHRRVLIWTLDGDLIGYDSSP